jgi:hypothetical protein
MNMQIKSLMIILLVLFIPMVALLGQSVVALDESKVTVSMLNQNPNPARTGEIIELRLGVGNYGSEPAQGITVFLEPEYPFIKLEGEDYSQDITTLNPYANENQEVGIKFRFMVDKNAPDGTHLVTVKSTEQDGEVTKLFEFNIDIQGKEYAQIITIDKSQINLGIEEDLDFVITNTGGTPLQNMVFSWTESTGTILPVFSDNNKYLKSLGVGESQTVSYKVMADVNAVPGLYKLDLNMRFNSYETVTQEISTTAGVFVGGKTDFDVTFSEGEAGKTSFSIANIGNTPAYSVTIVVPKQDNFKIMGNTASIVGNLDKGDYTIVSFNVVDLRTVTTSTEPLTDEQRVAKQSANTDNGIKVVVQYTDTSGKRHDVEKIIPIQLSTSSVDGTTPVPGSKRGMGGVPPPSTSSIWTTPTFYIPTVLIIVSIIGFIIYKRRKKAKKK